MSPLPPLFDHHAHLDDPAVSEAQVRGGLSSLQLVGGVSAGFGPERDTIARQRIRLDSRLFRAVGLHPWWLAATPESRWAAAWRQIATALGTPGVVALGEIGLDQTLRKRLPLAAQRSQLEHGLDLARQRDVPVVLHVVRWHGHALAALRDQTPPAGVVHGYGGPPELVPDLQRLGLHISLAAARWRRDPAGFAEVARVIDSAHLLVETDWPQGRGDWADALAEMSNLITALGAIRGVDQQELAQQLVANARALYRLTQ